MKKENSFVKAGAILVVSGFIVKILSAAYRIPLTRMLGASLMGHYSSVLNIFMPFFAFATAGIVPSVSRFTAYIKDKKDENPLAALKKRAMGLYAVSALAIMLLFIVFSKKYSVYMGEDMFFYGALILAPAIPVSAAEMVLKGLTQGSMNMLVTAKANVMEGFAKTVIGIGAVYYVINFLSHYPRNLAVMVCFAAITTSGLVSAVYLFFAVKKDGKGIKTETEHHIVSKRQLLSISVPVASSALVVSLVNFFDTAVCLPIIKNLPYKDIVQSFDGASFMGAEEMSMYLFGIYQGMALTLFNLVPAVMSYVGAACLPVLTKANTFSDKTYLINQTEKLFRVISLLSVPSSVFIYSFRYEITEFLFSTTPGQTEVASQLIAILIPFSVLSCFISGFNSIINAGGKSHVSFKILVFASVVRCVVGFVLCGISQVNIKALAVSAEDNL